MKRTKRKELLLTPSEFAAFQAAADRAGLPLSVWMVQVLRAVEQESRMLYPGAVVSLKEKGDCGIIVNESLNGFNHWNVKWEDGTVTREYGPDLILNRAPAQNKKG